MTDRADELAVYRKAVSDYIDKLEARERSQLLRKLASNIRRSQQQRIRAQVAPDGSRWAKRKPRTAQPSASYPVRFLYRNTNGDERLVDMRSWVRQGDRLTGYDREAGAMRTFVSHRIVRYLPPEGSADPGPVQGRLRRSRGAVRRKSQPMFVKLRARLKAGANGDEAYVEFRGRAARLARVHHFGLKDRVTPDGPEADYTQRELLGFSDADDEAILALLVDHMHGRL